MSVILDAAFRQLREVRADYEMFLLAQFAAAEEYCVGYLLNARGKAARIDSYSLFSGPFSRAYAYASEELLDFWASQQPRITFEMFEYAAADRGPDY